MTTSRCGSRSARVFVNLAPVRAVLDRSDGRERAGAVRLLNRGLNLPARRQGDIFGFVIRKDLARPQLWIGGTS